MPPKLSKISLLNEQNNHHCLKTRIHHIINVPALHAYIHIHTYNPWIYKCVIKRVGCGTSHKYTNIQIYSVKYYKYFTRTVL